MDLIIVGCGRIGSELAHSVVKDGHRLTIIDNSAMAFERLGTDFHGRTICGDVLNQDVLKRAGIEQANGLAAVTSDDATNFVVARAAKEIFQVPNVVVRAYDPRRRKAFETLGIRSIVSSSWGAQRIYQLLTHPGHLHMLTLGHGEVSVIEIRVGKDNQNTKLSDFAPQGYPVAVIRDGTARLPEPNVELQIDDLVIISFGADALPNRQEVA
jgi:trk system potassium uptake protein TrkA